MTALVFIISLLIGGFLNSCIYRIPMGESVVVGRFHCEMCGHTLGPLDLIPLLSFILLQGRCRYCNKTISLRYPVVEILTSLLFMVIYFVYKPSIEFVFYAIWIAILLIISAIDLRHRIIPNSLVILGMGLGLIFAFVAPDKRPYEAFLGMAMGIGIMSTIAIIAYVITGLQGLGGGDIKLLGMIGIFLGWKLTLITLLISIYIGGILCLLLVLLRLKEWGDYIPFGPFLSFGALISLLWGKDIIKWYMLLL